MAMTNIANTDAGNEVDVFFSIYIPHFASFAFTMLRQSGDWMFGPRGLRKAGAGSLLIMSCDIIAIL
jgi:hypothetical protein